GRVIFYYAVRSSVRGSGGEPALGFAAAARSSSVSRNAAVASYVFESGRGEPAGCIAVDRSLRTTFSQSSGLVLTCARSAGSITSPAVFILALWQVTQY